MAAAKPSVVRAAALSAHSPLLATASEARREGCTMPPRRHQEVGLAALDVDAPVENPRPASLEEISSWRMKRRSILY